MLCSPHRWRGVPGACVAARLAEWAVPQASFLHCTQTPASGRLTLSGRMGPPWYTPQLGGFLPSEVGPARPADRARLMLMKTVQTTASTERMRAH